MRKELAEQFQFNRADELPVGDVEEAYDNAMTSIQNHCDLGGQVKYPLYPTTELRNPTKWKNLFQISFCDGGTFIADPAKGEHVSALLNLFASFVKYDKKKCTDWVQDPAVYDALPAMIINFAQNSRIDSGY